MSYMHVSEDLPPFSADQQVGLVIKLPIACIRAFEALGHVPRIISRLGLLRRYAGLVL